MPDNVQLCSLIFRHFAEGVLSGGETSAQEYSAFKHGNILHNILTYSVNGL